MQLSDVVWRKSSYSTNNGGDCIELASTLGAIAVRDSKDAGGPKLLVMRREFAALLSELKR